MKCFASPLVRPPEGGCGPVVCWVVGVDGAL